MLQGGPFLGSPGAESLRTGGAPSCTANMPAHGVLHGARICPRLPSDRLSRGGQSCLRTPTVGASRGGDGSAWSLCLCMPFLGASHGSSGLCGARCGLRSHSHGGILDSPKSFCDGSGSFRGGVPSTPMSFRDGGCGSCSSGLRRPTVGAFHGSSSGGIPSLRHASLFAQRSNASGCAMVAFTTPPASSTLAVPSVGAGAGFASNDAPPGLCASTCARSLASAPAFSAM